MASPRKLPRPWRFSPVPPQPTSPARRSMWTAASPPKDAARKASRRSGSLRLDRPSIRLFDVHAVECVARHLRPNAVFLHRNLVHLDVVDLELAGLLVHPEIDVVVLVLAARLPEVGAGEVFPLLLEVAYRLVDLDKFERQGLAGLVVLDLEIAVLVLVRGDVAVDGAHHMPGAGHLHVARVLACRQPPPGLRRAGDHDPAVALLLRTFLHTDIHQLQVLPFGLEPEVDGVLLLRLVLVVEDNVREPTIAFHAAHILDLVKDEMEVGIEFRIAKHKGAVLGPLVDHLLHRSVDVLLGEAFGRAAHGWSTTLAGCRRSRS